MAGKILVVDDEPQIAEILERYLADEDFTVVTAHDGLAAVETFKTERPDLVILDLKLPGLSGVDVFHRLRAHADTPIIMLTARAEEVDRVLGLELGADDYIVKPFSPREVVARVKTVLRRLERSLPPAPARVSSAAAGSAGRRLVIGRLEIDTEEHVVTVDGREVNLTPTEFRILEILAAHPGRTFTRTHLLDQAKGEDLEVFERTLDRHIANVRRKIEADPSNPRYLLTVFGVGYKMAKDPNAQSES
jgi:DNA-binding response OmpR family regulator